MEVFWPTGLVLICRALFGISICHFLQAKWRVLLCCVNIDAEYLWSPFPILERRGLRKKYRPVRTRATSLTTLSRCNLCMVAALQVLACKEGKSTQAWFFILRVLRQLAHLAFWRWANQTNRTRHGLGWQALGYLHISFWNGSALSVTDDASKRYVSRFNQCHIFCAWNIYPSSDQDIAGVLNVAHPGNLLKAITSHISLTSHSFIFSSAHQVSVAPQLWSSWFLQWKRDDLQNMCSYSPLQPSPQI